MRSKFSAALVAAFTFMIATTAQATILVQNYTLDATPTGLTPLRDANGITAPARMWVLPGMTPFTVSTGDTLQINVTFTAPVSFVDTGNPFAGNLEDVLFSFSNAVSDPTYGFTRTSSITFAGVTGDFLGSPPPITTVSTPQLNQQQQIVPFVNANFTNVGMTITGFSLTTYFDSVSPLSAPLNIGRLFLIDDSYAVPAPSALTLLTLSFAGLGAMRRRRAASAA